MTFKAIFVRVQNVRDHTIVSYFDIIFTVDIKSCNATYCYYKEFMYINVRSKLLTIVVSRNMTLYEI